MPGRVQIKRGPSQPVSLSSPETTAEDRRPRRTDQRATQQRWVLAPLHPFSGSICPQDRGSPVPDHPWLLQGLRLPDRAKLFRGVRPRLECRVPGWPLAPSGQHLGQRSRGRSHLQIHLPVSAHLPSTNPHTLCWPPAEGGHERTRSGREGAAAAFPLSPTLCEPKLLDPLASHNHPSPPLLQTSFSNVRSLQNIL